MNRRLAALAALLVVTGNAVPLGQALWDRTGPARSVTEFSVRELAWSHTDDENTGIALEWNWRRATVDSVTDLLLDSLKLRCHPVAYSISCHDSRRGYAVVGIDTAEWRADSTRRVRTLDSLRRVGSQDTAYQAREVLAIGRSSRLAVLDVALDRASLITKWGERWPVLPADLETWWYAEASSSGRDRRVTVRVLPRELYLPSSFRHLARQGPGYRWNDSVPESFATVTVGRGGLPRITGVRWAEEPDR